MSEMAEVEVTDGGNTEEYVTAYQVHKLLGAKGVTRRPQMIYNYVKNGLIKSEILDGQRLVHVDVANEWIEKFVQKHLVEA